MGWSWLTLPPSNFHSNAFLQHGFRWLQQLRGHLRLCRLQPFRHGWLGFWPQWAPQMLNNCSSQKFWTVLDGRFFFQLYHENVGNSCARHILSRLPGISWWRSQWTLPGARKPGLHRQDPDSVKARNMLMFFFFFKGKMTRWVVGWKIEN